MPGQLLRSRQWGDEFVVYNDLSGDTHLLDSAAMDFLLQLQARAADDAGVAYPGQRAHDASEEQTADIDDVLATLANAFLIEGIAC
jgi:PqqD family protein of HPr-rel-A system